jgi:hypothetical protein
MTRNLVNKSVLTMQLARLCQFFEKALQKPLATAGIKVLGVMHERTQVQSPSVAAHGVSAVCFQLLPSSRGQYAIVQAIV